MTVNDLADRAMKNLGEDTGNSVLKSRFLDWVREAVSRVRALADLPTFNLREDSLNTVASQKTYALDADVSEIDTLFFDDGQQIDFVTLSSISDLDLTVQGRPIVWYAAPETGAAVQNISFYPIPDAVYALTIRARKGSELGDSDEIPFPSMFHGPLLEFVFMKSSEMEGQFQNAREHERRFEKAIADALRRLVAQNTHVPRLRVTDVVFEGRTAFPRLPGNFPRRF